LRARALQAPSPAANSDTGAVQRHANRGTIVLKDRVLSRMFAAARRSETAG